MANIMPGKLSRCPQCGEAGKRVNGATIKCMLRVPLTAYREVDYWFCRTAQCPVVYFSGDGAQTFAEADLREPVFQKHAERAETPICYCFGFSVGDVQQPEQAVHALAVIQAGVRAGQCACDWRNPQGDCCLGNVRMMVKRASAPVR